MAKTKGMTNVEIYEDFTMLVKKISIVVNNRAPFRKDKAAPSDPLELSITEVDEQRQPAY